MGVGVHDYAGVESNEDLIAATQARLSGASFDLIEPIVGALTYLGWLAAASLLILCGIAVWILSLGWICLFWWQTRLLQLTAKSLREVFEVESPLLQPKTVVDTQTLSEGDEQADNGVGADTVHEEGQAAQLETHKIHGKDAKGLKEEWEETYSMHPQDTQADENGEKPPVTLEADCKSSPAAVLCEDRLPGGHDLTMEQSQDSSAKDREPALSGSVASSRPSSTEFVERDDQPMPKRMNLSIEEKRVLAQTDWVEEMKSAAQVNLSTRCGPYGGDGTVSSNGAVNMSTGGTTLRYSAEQLKDARSFLSEATPAQKKTRSSIKRPSASRAVVTRQLPFRNSDFIPTRLTSAMHLQTTQPWLLQSASSITPPRIIESDRATSDRSTCATNAVPPHRRKAAVSKIVKENQHQLQPNGITGDYGLKDLVEIKPGVSHNISDAQVRKQWDTASTSGSPFSLTSRDILLKSVVHAVNQQVENGQHATNDAFVAQDHHQEPSERQLRRPAPVDDCCTTSVAGHDSALVTTTKEPLSPSSYDTNEVEDKLMNRQMGPQVGALPIDDHCALSASPGRAQGGYQHPDLLDLDFEVAVGSPIPLAVDEMLSYDASQSSAGFSSPLRQDLDRNALSSEVQGTDSTDSGQTLSIAPSKKDVLPFTTPSTDIAANHSPNTSGNCSSVSSLTSERDIVPRTTHRSPYTSSTVGTSITHGKHYSIHDLLSVRETTSTSSSNEANLDETHLSQQPPVPNGTGLHEPQSLLSAALTSDPTETAERDSTDEEHVTNSADPIADPALAQDSTTPYTASSNDEEQVWEVKGSKRALQERKKAARQALFVAKHVREDARSRVAANFSLDGMKQLQKVTIEYNDRRQALKDCMASGELNEEDAKAYPPLLLRDLARSMRSGTEKRKATS